MTTIAWRDGVMAGDSQTDDDGTKMAVRKVYILPDGRVVGFAGAVDNWVRFLAWLRDGGERPTFTPEERNRFCALVMAPDGSCEEWETERAGRPIEADFWAAGTGAKAALAAMHMGADAKRAVEIAALVDTYTGGAITVVSAPKRKLIGNA